MKCKVEEQDLRFVRSVLGDCLTLLNDVLGSNIEDGLIDQNDKAFLEDISTAYDLISNGLEEKS